MFWDGLALYLPKIEIDRVIEIIDQHYLNEKPSGLVAVRECNCISITGAIYKHCTYCHGTGRIVRDLSVAEALEWAKWKANMKEPAPVWLVVGDVIMRKEDLP